MTEKELRDIRKLTDRWYQDDEISFRQSSVYDSLLDEVERLQKALRALTLMSLPDVDYIAVEQLYEARKIATEALEEKE